MGLLSNLSPIKFFLLCITAVVLEAFISEGDANAARSRQAFTSYFLRSLIKSTCFAKTIRDMDALLAESTTGKSG